jgi:hypothetical protein
MEHDANGFYWSWTRDGYADISVGPYFTFEEQAWLDAAQDWEENPIDETE